MHELTCAECNQVSDKRALDWRGYTVEADEGGEEVVFFCPLCAEREFQWPPPPTTSV
ncbi:MAG: hypothetical protein H0X39_13280 [Actinobacteria bacterium]|nr:hypothetical protein [Actinomycetota bacterium]